jgi:hypothetical protein
MTTTERTLLHICFEEFTSNGGNFASPDSHKWLEGLAEFGENSKETLTRLMAQQKEK